jgi:pSer/pThr/pTyr-binding forkhead associated (FHA) protein
VSVCGTCGKENQGHYKFCLGCGAELSDGAPAQGAPKPTAEAAEPSVAEPAKSASPPRALADVDLKEPATDPDLESLPHDTLAEGTRGSIVAGLAGVSGVAGGVENGRAAEVAPSLAKAAAASRPASARTCPECGSVVPAGFAFCGQCGARVDGGKEAARTMHLGQLATPGPTKGRLVLIRPDGSEGGSHPLEEGENLIGRNQGAMFASDGYLSPRHAQLVMNAAGTVVRDIGSLNGVFLKLTDEEELKNGDVFRIGQELLRFDVIRPPQPLEDGTEVMGSPNPGYWGRLALVVGRDQEGSAFPLLGDTVVLGRERGDIIFPEDGYVSGTHARISARDGRFYLSDLNSSNGTFKQIRGDRAITAGSFILVGQQLFRLTIP